MSTEQFDGQTLTIRRCPPLTGLPPARRAGMAGVVHDTRVDIKNRSGWTQGTYESALTGGHCILGAIDEVRERHEAEDVELATAYLQEHLPGRDGIVAFNDAFFRMKGRVVEELGRIEVELDPAGHPRCHGEAIKERERIALGGIDDRPVPALGPGGEAEATPWRSRLGKGPCVQVVAVDGTPLPASSSWAPVELTPTVSDHVAASVRSVGGLRVVAPVSLGVLAVGWVIAPVALLLALGSVALVCGGAVAWQTRDSWAPSWRWGEIDDDGGEGDELWGGAETVPPASHETVRVASTRPAPAVVATSPAETPAERPVAVPEAEPLPVEAPAPVEVPEPRTPAEEDAPAANAPAANAPDVLPGDVAYRAPTTLEAWAAERDPAMLRVAAERPEVAGQPQALQVESRLGLQVDGGPAAEVHPALTEGYARQSNGELALALNPPRDYQDRLRAAWMPGVDRPVYREVAGRSVEA